MHRHRNRLDRPGAELAYTSAEACLTMRASGRDRREALHDYRG